MEERLYKEIERYMLSCMKDSAHDCTHIYRVLYMALELAKDQDNIDMEVLITAALLHDIGRSHQFIDENTDHAHKGSEIAYEYLVNTGWDIEKALHVKACILTHRFRSDNPPKSAEAKILFDADKLDVTGAMGIARTLLYNGTVGRPIYSVDDFNNIIKKEGTFFYEYDYKLKNIYDIFYTEKGKIIAEERKKACTDFYESLYNEVSIVHENGKKSLKEAVKDS